MKIESAIALSLVVVVLYLVVKRYREELSVFVLIGGVGLLALVFISYFRPVLEELGNLTGDFGLNSNYISILLKATGISILGTLASGLCADAGVNSLAAQVELVSKVFIITISLPLFKDLLSVLLNILQG